MCGITGILATNKTKEALLDRLSEMQAALVHRGPDDDGVFTANGAPLVLGHRRLEIIDPKGGHQPMTDGEGRVTIVFNGEIYNYLELRRELLTLGFPLQTYSDTEVIIYSYLAWGEDCLKKFRGMFAFALWDNAKERLFCARDRLGIKPFYYFFDGEHFIFASEIKAILKTDWVPHDVDPIGMQDYLTFQSVLEDRTLFKDIYKLAPGEQLIVDYNSHSLKFNKSTYWDIDLSDREPLPHNEAYYVDQLQWLLEDSVNQHLRSDVAIGGYLSGGLDSSICVSLATRLLDGSPFKTFTGAFREGQAFDETRYAKIVADAAGAEYHDVYITGDDFADTLGTLIYAMDEPAAGPGLIPQYHVSKLAKDHVKVVLGGQGGDELFLGYARYLVLHLEHVLHQAITRKGDSQDALARLEPHLNVLREYKPMLRYFLAEGLFERDDARYFRLMDRSLGMRALFADDVFKDNETFGRFQQIYNKPDTTSAINKMSYFDLKASLPALLQVEDRVSMAASLEARVPLLDHHLVEFVAQMPASLRFADGRPKHLLKAAVKNIVPDAILAREDKMGFPMPLDDWLEQGARSFVNDTLLSSRAQSRGFYNTKAIQSFLDSSPSFNRSLWGLLSFEVWCQTFIDR